MNEKVIELHFCQLKNYRKLVQNLICTSFFSAIKVKICYKLLIQGLSVKQFYYFLKELKIFIFVVFSIFFFHQEYFVFELRKQYIYLKRDFLNCHLSTNNIKREKFFKPFFFLFLKFALFAKVAAALVHYIVKCQTTFFFQ